jgi:RNA polymerase sigma factor (sigma-70 family)
MGALIDTGVVSDAELACAAATGDRNALAAIYDRYADRLHQFCVAMVRDRDTAADCVQDVFCTAAARLPMLRESQKLRPWLYAVARNHARQRLRERDREQTFGGLPERASGDPGPETMAARAELADLIAEAAGGLSDRDRAALDLAYRHGLNGSELGQALGVSPRTANKIVFRLRHTVERALGAVLLLRNARHTGCSELEIIAASRDGSFNVLMRKRIVRHIDSCHSCDAERRRLVIACSPFAPPGADESGPHQLPTISITSPSAATAPRWGSARRCSPQRRARRAPGATRPHRAVG